MAAIPNRYTLEHQTINNRLMDDLVTDPVLPVNGYVTVPERPGLGIELDEAAMAGNSSGLRATSLQTYDEPPVARGQPFFVQTERNLTSITPT